MSDVNGAKLSRLRTLSVIQPRIIQLRFKNRSGLQLRERYSSRSRTVWSSMEDNSVEILELVHTSTEEIVEIKKFIYNSTENNSVEI